LKLGAERKIKFWLASIGRVAVILFICVKAYNYFAANSEDQKVPPKDSIKKVSDITLDEATPENNRITAPETSPKKFESSKIVEMESVSIKTISLTKLLKYQGTPLLNAYFKIAGCETCVSSITKKDGLAKIQVPITLYKDGLTHEFFIYRSDSLLYQKSMRFVNLQFDKY